MEDSLQKLKDMILALPQGLQDHLFRTRDVALDLAALHGVSPDKVEMAALGHDLARARTGEELLSAAREIGLTIHPVEEQVPMLLHGAVAAELLKRECKVDDAEVLDAVRWHSTAAPGLQPVGLVVFLADKLDPHKLQRSPHLHEVAAMARTSLEQAVVSYLTMELTLLLKRGSLLHPLSIEARNHLLSRQEEKT